MTRDQEHKDRVAFFLKHAGWSYATGATTGEQALARVECAEELARAEEQMEARGWFVRTEWDWDDCADPDDDGETARAIDAGEMERLIVRLHDEDGQYMTSLGSVIVYADQRGAPYVRVVAAELASELLATHEECHARVTCGGCGNAWCEACDPAPSALCHWCHGRGASTAEMDPASEEMSQ